MRLTIIKLAEILGTSVEYLLKGKSKIFVVLFWVGW